ncbi:putative reverse transcriptase domain-containing protein, partial [Tanacetum coccineum]
LSLFIAGGDGAGGAGAGGAGADGAGADGARVGGAGPVEAEITGCTYMTFMKCNPHTFKGTEGAVGLCQWFEKLESVFRISDCREKDKVKFATATLQGRALTWWNGRTASMGIDAANGTPWAEVRKWMTEEFCPRSVLQRLEQELYNLKLKGTDIDGYTNRFHELALLCPRMVEPEQVKVEQYIRGLSKNIRGDVTSSQPATIDHAVRMAYQLMGQIIQDKTDEVHEGEKRKGEGDRGGRGDNRRDYNNRQNQRRANAGAMTNAVSNDNEVCPKCKNKKHNGDCWKCGKCGKLGHKTAACRCPDKREVTCFNCNKKGHLKKDCPTLRKNGQGGNNRGAVYKLGAVDAQQDPKVVTELESFDIIIGMDCYRDMMLLFYVERKRLGFPWKVLEGHRFSPKKTSAVSEKTSPRSDLRWKPMGRIFKSVGLRWIPTGKLFDSCTSKVDSEPLHGSNVDIPHIHECKQP